MRRLGIAHKLWAVCLGFALPIVVMFVFMVRAKLQQIDFASKEMAGDAFQRPLEDVLEHIGRHRRLWTSYERRQPGALGRLRAESQRVSGAIERLMRSERALGEELQFTPHGLGLRQRSEFTAGSLRERWDALVASQESMDAATALASYGALVAHVRTMITHAGDTSNLILDPDLDSYYLMDVTLLALPQFEDRLQQLTDEVSLLATTGRASHVQRMRLASQAAFLEEADWGRIAASSKTALNEDRNFFGSSPSLSRVIPPFLVAGNELSTRVVDALRGLASDETFETRDIERLLSDLHKLADLAYAFHRAAFAEEDSLLRTRIEHLQGDLAIGCALALCAVLVSSLLAFALSASIIRRVGSISAATQAFSQGMLSARVGGAGTDELGALADSFDSMAGRIERLNSEVQKRADQLAEANASLEQTVMKRTAELSERNASFKLILDSSQDGMLTVDLSGNMLGERSAAVARWLGEGHSSRVFADYVHEHDPTFAADFQSGLQQVHDDILPLELTLAQLPQSMKLRQFETDQANGSEPVGHPPLRHLRARYQPIVAGERVSALLIVLSDATAELAAQKATAAQEEALRIFHACQRDRSGFLGFVLEARDMMQSIRTSESQVGFELARTIHTLKGNCALFGVFSLATMCHEIEYRMAELGGPPSRSDVEQLVQGWEEVLGVVAQFTGESAAKRLEIGDEEYAALFESIARGTPRRDLLLEIARWRLEPIERHFARLAEQAKGVAHRLGKDLTVQIEANDIRLCDKTWAPMWSTLVHVIRNAVDHGLESEEERVAAGKHPAGYLKLKAEHSEGQFRVEIADDGRGIDWTRIAAKAKERGLPCATQSDLSEVLFIDGISTKQVVTNLSGRGVGMAAVRETCRALRGEVEIHSVRGAGTLVRCRFPDSAMGGAWLAPVRSVVLADSIAPRLV